MAANLIVTHNNPGTTQPLILPIEVVCAVPDYELRRNILVNSITNKKWAKLQPAHAKKAIICGSAPSIKWRVDEIKRAIKETDSVIFALNGCAKFLNECGVIPDYQVIVDPKARTAELIGDAKQYLFASQVNPKLFELKPDAILWQVLTDLFDESLKIPEHDDDYCLIGGGVSVGNSTACLVYALGFRDLEFYGIDSSNQGVNSHVMHQALNDGEPMVVVDYRRKTYHCSYTMKLQAEQFQGIAKALIEQGCTIKVHGYGLLPDMFNAPPLTELEKYHEMWSRPEYGIMSPGASIAEEFVRECRPSGTVIDFGCGSGKGAEAIHKLTGLKVILVDFVDNSVINRLHDMEFVRADLTKRMDLSGDYGFCCDVLEHIPPNDVDNVIINIMNCVPVAFFQISCVSDTMGSLIGEELHLSIHPHNWWYNLFCRLGFKIISSLDQGQAVIFHITRKEAS